jgi:hypothetical protein
MGPVLSVSPFHPSTGNGSQWPCGCGQHLCGHQPGAAAAPIATINQAAALNALNCSSHVMCPALTLLLLLNHYFYKHSSVLLTNISSIILLLNSISSILLTNLAGGGSHRPCGCHWHLRGHQPSPAAACHCRNRQCCRSQLFPRLPLLPPYPPPHCHHPSTHTHQHQRSWPWGHRTGRCRLGRCSEPCRKLPGSCPPSSFASAGSWGDESVTSMAFSHVAAAGDPMWLAVGHCSGSVVVWDLQRRPARPLATIGE